MKIKFSSFFAALGLTAIIVVSGCRAQQDIHAEEKKSTVAADSTPAKNQVLPPVTTNTAQPTKSAEDNRENNRKVTSPTSIIGNIIKPTEIGVGCYFVPPADINKSSDERRYLVLIDDDGNGLINLDGEDRQMIRQKSEQTNQPKGKKEVLWLFSAGKFKIKLNLKITGTSNDDENTHFNATIEVNKDERKQTLAAKGFCGG